MELKRTDSEGAVKRMDVFLVWRNASAPTSKTSEVMKFFTDKTNYNEFDHVIQEECRKKVLNLCAQFAFKWKMSNRSMTNILSQNKEWLEKDFTFLCPSGNQDNQHADTTIGRPRKPFADSSRSAQKRKLQPVIAENSSDELVLATQVKLRSEGKRDVARVLQMVASPSVSPKRAKRIKKTITSQVELPTKITLERSLALFVDNKFTKEQYIDIQQTTKAHDANIYPTYNRLLEAKKLCYPDNIVIKEESGEVPLQCLLQHTINRLFTAQKEVLETYAGQYDPSTLRMYFKWGCDGASRHSRYMQAFEDLNNDDASIYLISIVPVRLTATSTNNTEMVLWNNPVPSSTKYCRPVKLIFHKETPDFVTSQVTNIKQQIKDLLPTKIDFCGVEHTVNSVFTLTMIDGKTCSTIASTSAQNCHVCNATPKMMNDLTNVRNRPVNKEALKLGISSLHAWIKSLECVLHIGYKLEVKRWKVSKDTKHIVEARKKQVQEKLRRSLNILVDLPKQGYGSSNTGNVARTFFSNPEQAAEATGVKEQFICRLSTILRTICSGFAINVPAFERYASETANMYVEEYSWYYMPQTLHKILIHGSLIIKEAILPIGMLSEEAQEHRNKDVRNFREFHSRKFSRKQNVEDLFHMLLVSSDPLVSSLRRSKPKLSSSLPAAVLSLLELEDSEKNKL